ncbi:MAG: pantetheine-phosphate adenylyltransferase [Clostridia bacterium]|nr:pantetheine-phosphate adenylyltransferase [Clostridia bacterium]
MKIAVCPGSFDPVTLGHLDVISRASKLFDKVIVVVMTNPSKSSSTFTVEERVKLIEKCIPDMENVEVDSYSGLLAEYAKMKGAVAIVKGLRALSDFEYEFQQSLINRQLNPDMDTLFLSAKHENMFLSSSLVRNVCSLGGDISGMVPKEIEQEIINRINGKEV